METWVDLKVLNRAEEEFLSFVQLEKSFRFSPVINPTGSMVTYNYRTDIHTGCREVLLDFEDEQALTWFLLRFS
jgi:hypothetical protein